LEGRLIILAAERIAIEYESFLATIARIVSEDLEKIRNDLDALRLQAAKMGEATESLL